MRLTVPMIALCAALAGCSIGSDLQATDTAVNDFHSRLDAEKFSAVEEMAGPEVKTGPQSFASILELVHHRLGAVKSTKRTGFNDNVNNGLHTVEVTYETAFANGPGTESFVFRMKDGATQLAGYHVKSPVLAN